MYKTWAGIDIVTASLIMGSTGFTAEMLQLGFGYLCDRGHRKKILLLGMLIASSVFLITLVNSTLLLFALVFSVMLGSSAFHPAGMGMASRLFASKNRTILLFTAGGVLGFGLSQLIFSKAVELFNGQIFPLLLPLVVLVPWLIWHRFPTETTKERPAFRDFLIPFKLERRSLSLLYLTQVTSYGVQLAFGFLLPDILLSKHCHAWACKGGGHLSLISGMALGMVLVGFFFSGWSHKKLLTICKTTGAALLYAFLLIPEPSLVLTIIMLAALGATLYQCNPLITAWGHYLVPNHPSTISGLLMGFAWCFSNLVPMLAGLLSPLFPASPYIIPMQLVGLFLILSLALMLLIPSKQTTLKAVTN